MTTYGSDIPLFSTPFRPRADDQNSRRQILRANWAGILQKSLKSGPYLQLHGYRPAQPLQRALKTEDRDEIGVKVRR